MHDSKGQSVVRVVRQPGARHLMLLDIPGSERLYDHGLQTFQGAKIGVLHAPPGVPAGSRQIRHLRLRKRHGQLASVPPARSVVALAWPPQAGSPYLPGATPPKKAHATFRAEHPEHRGFACRKRLSCCKGEEA